MSQKSEKTGVVVSNKMQKSITVAVEWQVRDGLYVSNARGEIYWLADRRAPTQFFDNFPVQAHPQYAPEQIRDLLRHPPAAVVIPPGDVGDPGSDALFKTRRYALRYQPLGPIAGGGVFLRRD